MAKEKATLQADNGLVSEASYGWGTRWLCAAIWTLFAGLILYLAVPQPKYLGGAGRSIVAILLLLGVAYLGVGTFRLRYRLYEDRIEGRFVFRTRTVLRHEVLGFKMVAINHLKFVMRDGQHTSFTLWTDAVWKHAPWRHYLESLDRMGGL